MDKLGYFLNELILKVPIISLYVLHPYLTMHLIHVIGSWENEANEEAFLWGDKEHWIIFYIKKKHQNIVKNMKICCTVLEYSGYLVANSEYMRPIAGIWTIQSWGLDR